MSSYEFGEGEPEEDNLSDIKDPKFRQIAKDYQAAWDALPYGTRWQMSQGIISDEIARNPEAFEIPPPEWFAEG